MAKIDTADGGWKVPPIGKKKELKNKEQRKSLVARGEREGDYAPYFIAWQGSPASILTRIYLNEKQPDLKQY